MQQIINFVIRNKNFLLFLLLFAVSVILTIQTNSFHRSQFINSANRLTGGTYGIFSSVSQYFGLKSENQRLIIENQELKERLFNNGDLNNLNSPSIALDSNYAVLSARVVKNSYSSNYNFITLNKGFKDSIREDNGVITDKGIVGIIDRSSSKYSRVISILNRNSRINAQLKKSNHFGSLIWDGGSPNTVKLIDVSKFANVSLNDTIITGGQSAIFPKGIGIGKVIDIADDIGGDTYILSVELFNDMTDLGFVYVIGNTDRKEILELERAGDD